MTQYSFSTFSYPNSIGSEANGINDGGEVVGGYSTLSESAGYTLNGQSFVSYQPDNGLSTELTGASDNGIFVGNGLFYLNGDLSLQSFTYEDGKYQLFSGPTNTSDGTFAAGINPSGQEIVGYYQEGDYQIGFIYGNGSITSVAYPEIYSNTELNGINDAGEVVGTASYIGGFLYTGGVFTSINYPGIGAVDPMGISDTGEIVGTFRDGAGNIQGFADVDGVFTEVDVPGSSDTYVDGVNAAGQLVGNYDTSNNTSGSFVATPVVCFCEGTRIRVVRNDHEVDVAVETLVVGDLVVMRRGVARTIQWLGHRSINCAHHPCAEELWPIGIAAGALGIDEEGRYRPSRDLRISPGHSLCLDVLGEILVPASALVDGQRIRRERVASVTYWHVELDQHDILLAENMPCESYLEMGNRDFFVDEALVRLRSSPDTIPTPSASTHSNFCRAFHVDGPLVAAVRRRLAVMEERIASPRDRAFETKAACPAVASA